MGLYDFTRMQQRLAKLNAESLATPYYLPERAELEHRINVCMGPYTYDDMKHLGNKYQLQPITLAELLELAAIIGSEYARPTGANTFYLELDLYQSIRLFADQNMRKPW